MEDVVQTLKKVEEMKPTEQEAETTTPLTLLKRLHSYRKQCEANSEYVEAPLYNKQSIGPPIIYRYRHMYIYMYIYMYMYMYMCVVIYLILKPSNDSILFICSLHGR